MQTPASCTCCVPATPRCKPPAPAVPVAAVAAVQIWRCTALRSRRWAAGWAWCRCGPVVWFKWWVGGLRGALQAVAAPTGGSQRLVMHPAGQQGCSQLTDQSAVLTCRIDVPPTVGGGRCAIVRALHRLAAGAGAAPALAGCCGCDICSTAAEAAGGCVRCPGRPQWEGACRI